MTNPTTKPNETTALASLCKAAGEPLRLEILRVLHQDTFGVQELADIFEMPQPGMSHHLKVLTKSELLSTRRQGNSIFYRRALVGDDGRFAAFKRQLFDSVDSLTLDDGIVARMEAVHKERSAQSQAFFEKNAEKLQEQQGRLCELDQYGGSLLAMLDSVNLQRRHKVLEVGPGHGELLGALADRFDQVVALERSEQMLAVAKDRAAHEPKLEFVRGALEDFGEPDEPYDAVVLNMVLHHMASPATVFEKLRKLTPAHGVILLADLCAHEQEWVRESCGDLWMGFAADEVESWAEAAGFQSQQHQFLGLRNGFQIQLMLFRK